MTTNNTLAVITGAVSSGIFFFLSILWLLGIYTPSGLLLLVNTYGEGFPEYFMLLGLAASQLYLTLFHLDRAERKQVTPITVEEKIMLSRKKEAFSHHPTNGLVEVANHHLALGIKELLLSYHLR